MDLVPIQPGSDVDDTAWSWTMPADFSGSQTLSIQVTGGTFILAASVADRCSLASPDSYMSLIYQQSIDDVQVWDPMTDVTIDEASHTRGTDLTGQWYWTILSGQTFSANFNVTAGVTAPDWAADQTYPAQALVVYENQVWIAGASSPAGTTPTSDPTIWFTLPVANWNINATYNYLARVRHNDLTYTALQAVPAGTDINDTQYWNQGETP